MREYPPLSPQLSYEAGTQSEEISKLGSTCPSPLPTPDTNFSSPTISLNDESMASFRDRPMSTQTFPFDVFTRKDSKLRLPLQRRASSISCTPANTVSAPTRRPFTAFHPLSAARYAFNRSVKSFRSWSTSGRRSSASIAPTDALLPPAPVPMSVDDYGPMLFQDIDWLAYEANQQAFTSTQQLHPRDILRAQELEDFFTECENLDYTEARLFDGSESKVMAPAENSGTSIKSSDIEDDADSPIMLYAGLRQCGGVTQRNRGRVAHDYWSIKDDELMRSDQEAIRTAFLDERKAAREQLKTVLVDEEQKEEQKGQVEQQVEQMEQIEEITEVPAEETI